MVIIDPYQTPSAPMTPETSPETDAMRAQIPGTGLGLSVAQHLAEAMGGRLSVSSEVGLGSVFTLHLRAAEAESGELAHESLEEDKVME